MTRKLETLGPGDVLEMRTNRLPESVGAFRAAVERVEGDTFSVFSTELSEFRLTPEDLTFRGGETDFQILDRTDATVAVPQESGGFSKGERLRATRPDPAGQILEGTLVAAIDNLLYCVTDDGEDFTASPEFMELAKG